MAALLKAWTEFDKWNGAFRDVVYGGAYAHLPVFLDVEDALLVEVAHRRGLELTAAEAERTLAADVRATLMLGPANSGAGVLSWHRHRLDEWQWRRRWAADGRAAAPPVLALLAVFARAAELMGQDDQYTSAAYFPRLHRLLRVEKADEQRVATAYRQHAERFWGALNSWLESMGGTRGLPTAEPLGPRYVGIALSQALIRETDRQLLTEFFVSTDLEPGLRLNPDEMAVYLETWARAGHGSASIRKLLKSAAGRKVLSEAASSALVQWDGAFASDGRRDRIGRRPLLTARVARSGLGGARLRLGFALRGSVLGHQALPSRWRILSASSHVPPEIELETLTDRLLAPLITDDIDETSLLTGQLRISPVGEEQDGSCLMRKPQPIVLLSYVDEAGLFVEVDRARLFESHMLLVNAAAKRPNGTPMFDLDELLADIAQPGFTKVAGATGIPSGWVLYRDVIIAHRHDRPEFALDPLKPAQSSALKVSGGFRMPGHAARWHADVPLDVRGSTSDAQELNIRLLALGAEGEETEVAHWCARQAEITVTTEGVALSAGHYRGELHATGATRKDDADSSVTFTICSSDDPRVRPEAAPLGYCIDSQVGALAAVPLETPTGQGSATVGYAVRGVVTTALCGSLPSQGAPENVWWRQERATVQRAILAEPAAADSCAVSGRHHEHIETHHKGMKYNRAECLGCGRVKLYRPKASPKASTALNDLHLRHPLEHLGAVHGPRTVGGETLLDALVWLGGGEPHEVAHLVRQVDDSALTVDEIVRALECLGHIDVVRDPRTFTVKEWAVAPRGLAGLEDASWFVAGSWNCSSIRRLRDAVEDAGGALVVDSEGWLPRRRVTGLDEPTMQAIGHALEATVVPSAGSRLLGRLPPLSVVASRLPRISADGVFDAEWFNTAAAAWVGVQSIGEAGAYRLRRGFVSTYLFRTKDDVGQGTALRATAQAVKHLASSHRPLVGYNADTQTLFVPLGADLPGLYGRALALLSGQPPSRVAGQPLLAYPSVSPAVARAVVALMKE